jgi:methylmalonyl-CoA mutase
MPQLHRALTSPCLLTFHTPPPAIVQARIDSGEDVVVGVNKYRLPDGCDSGVEVKSIDNNAVRKGQIERLEHIKSTRDSAKVKATLAALEEAARVSEKDGGGNLLQVYTTLIIVLVLVCFHILIFARLPPWHLLTLRSSFFILLTLTKLPPSPLPAFCFLFLQLAIDAARERATLGEISTALENVYGRHQATTQVVQGAYTAAYSSDNKAGTAGAGVESAMAAVRDFEENNGRRPRLLVVKMGQDGHDRGAKVNASLVL